MLWNFSVHQSLSNDVSGLWSVARETRKGATEHNNFCVGNILTVILPSVDSFFSDMSFSPIFRSFSFTYLNYIISPRVIFLPQSMFEHSLIRILMLFPSYEENLVVCFG